MPQTLDRIATTAAPGAPQPDDWYRRDVAAVLTALNTSAAGLDATAAQARLSQYGPSRRPGWCTAQER